MVNIRITDYIERPSDYEDGQKIFDLIVADVTAGKPVSVSFEGISAVPTAFVNAAFIQLVERTTLGTIRSNLSITHSTKFINDMIRSRFDFIESQQVPTRH
jgi:hypothetical protein